MKIIVGSIDGDVEEYYAEGWTIDENGVLKILRSYSDVIGAHAQNAWCYVREVEE